MGAACGWHARSLRDVADASTAEAADVARGVVQVVHLRSFRRTIGDTTASAMRMLR
jgi:hypothetical protein